MPPYLVCARLQHQAAWYAQTILIYLFCPLRHCMIMNLIDQGLQLLCQLQRAYSRTQSGQYRHVYIC